MSEKIVSMLDVDGYFIGPTVADESPLEPGVYLIPAHAVDVPPPAVPAGQCAKYEGGKFHFENAESPEPAKPVAPPSDAELLAQSQAEVRQYLNSTDWYITRQIETGKLVPTEVLERRQQARSILN